MLAYPDFFKVAVSSSGIMTTHLQSVVE